VNVTSGLSLKLAAVLLAAMALGACGRKGGLDLPPSASAAPAGSGSTPTAQVDPDEKAAAAAQNNLFNSANPADRSKYAPKLPPKRIILDPILD
jgi:predicted small lipoprotein YifL